MVVLQHPGPSQVYEDGFVEEQERCRTLAAEKELVEFGSSDRLGTESITLFDSMPYMTRDYEDYNVHDRSQKTFLRALEAKRPDVVISCFRTHTKDKFLHRLQASGVGVSPLQQTLQQTLVFPASRHR